VYAQSAEPAEVSPVVAIVYVPAESVTEPETVEQVVEVVLVPIANTSSSPAATLLVNVTEQLVLVQVLLVLCEMPGIVKVVEAVSVPPSVPVATTVYAFGVSDGTVKVQVKAPELDVVSPVQVWVVGVAPLNVKVVIFVLGENPDPVAPIPVVPAAPLVGDSVMAGVVTVTKSVALPKPVGVAPEVTPVSVTM
jgi:hypothetical protein